MKTSYMSDCEQESLPAYWNGTYYAMLVYDVSSQESLESSKAWLEDVKKARCVCTVRLQSVQRMLDLVHQQG